MIELFEKKTSSKRFSVSLFYAEESVEAQGQGVFVVTAYSANGQVDTKSSGWMFVGGKKAIEGVSATARAMLSEMTRLEGIQLVKAQTDCLAMATIKEYGVLQLSFFFRAPDILVSYSGLGDKPRFSPGSAQACRQLVECLAALDTAIPEKVGVLSDVAKEAFVPPVLLREEGLSSTAEFERHLQGLAAREVEFSQLPGVGAVAAVLLRKLRNAIPFAIATCETCQTEYSKPLRLKWQTKCKRCYQTTVSKPSK